MVQRTVISENDREDNPRAGECNQSPRQDVLAQWRFGDLGLIQVEVRPKVFIVRQEVLTLNLGKNDRIGCHKRVARILWGGGCETVHEWGSRTKGHLRM